MSKRNVVVKSGETDGLKTFETEASNFGELKAQLGEEINFNNQKIVVKPGNTSLTENSAELPEGDFYLFLTPTKMEAGE